MTMVVRPLGEPGQRRLHRPLRVRIEGRRGFVEYEDTRVFEQHPRDGEPLLLAPGEAVAPLPDDGVEPVRQVLNDIQHGRGAAGLDHLGVGGVRARNPHVDAHGVVEEECFLGDVSNLSSQRL